ncbi:MAG: sigma 54-interacting transcriptional regulator [Clostridium sp.]|nr:sigma 54-interacting transcriptional regulator [Clostridium sp.]
MENAKRIANTNCNVLILGDSGTGKEMMAQSIHSASNRSNGPLVIVNCAVLPRNLVESELFGYEKGAFTGASSEGNPGKFELADKGTLFLDEIGELPLEIQPKLLRAIEDHAVSRIGGKSAKPIDVRLICATNRNLAKEIHMKTFRADLFYRINVITLRIPPLNERGNDVIYLADHFVNKLNKDNNTSKKLSLDFLNKLAQTNWEGNVRQLENTITQAYYLSSPDSNLLTSLPDYNYEDEQIPKPSIEATSMQNIERNAIVYALKINKGKVANAATDLNLGRTTIYRKIKHFEITPDEYL